MFTNNIETGVLCQGLKLLKAPHLGSKRLGFCVTVALHPQLLLAVWEFIALFGRQVVPLLVRDGTNINCNFCRSYLKIEPHYVVKYCKVRTVFMNRRQFTWQVQTNISMQIVQTFNLDHTIPCKSCKLLIWTIRCWFKGHSGKVKGWFTKLWLETSLKSPILPLLCHIRPTLCGFRLKFAEVGLHLYVTNLPAVVCFEFSIPRFLVCAIDILGAAVMVVSVSNSYFFTVPLYSSTYCDQQYRDW